MAKKHDVELRITTPVDTRLAILRVSERALRVREVAICKRRSQSYQYDELNALNVLADALMQMA